MMNQGVTQPWPPYRRPGVESGFHPVVTMHARRSARVDSAGVSGLLLASYPDCPACRCRRPARLRSRSSLPHPCLRPRHPRTGPRRLLLHHPEEKRARLDDRGMTPPPEVAECRSCCSSIEDEAARGSCSSAPGKTRAGTTCSGSTFTAAAVRARSGSTPRSLRHRPMSSGSMKRFNGG
jgi:hypothetical protein